MQFARAALILLLVTVAFGAGQVPRPAEPLEIETMDGRTLSLKQLRGKVVVVMFFSTDCPHCQRATQAIAPIYADWKSRGLEILGLAANPSAKTNLRQFAERYNANFPLALAGRSDWARFGGFSMMRRPPYVPHMLFVDRKGIIREERTGADHRFQDNMQAAFGAIVDKLLKEPS